MKIYCKASLGIQDMEVHWVPLGFLWGQAIELPKRTFISEAHILYVDIAAFFYTHKFKGYINFYQLCNFEIFCIP